MRATYLISKNLLVLFLVTYEMSILLSAEQKTFSNMSGLDQRGSNMPEL